MIYNLKAKMLKSNKNIEFARKIKAEAKAFSQTSFYSISGSKFCTRISKVIQMVFTIKIINQIYTYECY